MGFGFLVVLRVFWGGFWGFRGVFDVVLGQLVFSVALLGLGVWSALVCFVTGWVLCAGWLLNFGFGSNCSGFDLGFWWVLGFGFLRFLYLSLFAFVLIFRVGLVFPLAFGCLGWVAAVFWFWFWG